MLAQLECPRGQTQALHRQRLVLVLLALVLYRHRLVLVLLAAPPTAGWLVTVSLCDCLVPTHKHRRQRLAGLSLEDHLSVGLAERAPLVVVVEAALPCSQTPSGKPGCGAPTRR